MGAEPGFGVANPLRGKKHIESTALKYPTMGKNAPLGQNRCERAGEDYGPRIQSQKSCRPKGRRERGSRRQPSKAEACGGVNPRTSRAVRRVKGPGGPPDLDESKEKEKSSSLRKKTGGRIRRSENPKGKSSWVNRAATASRQNGLRDDQRRGKND